MFQEGPASLSIYFMVLWLTKNRHRTFCSSTHCVILWLNSGANKTTCKLWKNALCSQHVERVNFTWCIFSNSCKKITGSTVLTPSKSRMKLEFFFTGSFSTYPFLPSLWFVQFQESRRNGEKNQPPHLEDDATPQPPLKRQARFFSLVVSGSLNRC